MTNLTAYSLSVLFLSGLLGLVFLAATFPKPAFIILASLSLLFLIWGVADIFKGLASQL
jgi:hypothetical protein